METPQSFEEGMRLRSRVLASPFIRQTAEFCENSEEISREDFENVQINTRAMSSSENAIISEKPISEIRDLNNENGNAFSASKSHEILTLNTSPATRPKQLGTDKMATMKNGQETKTSEFSEDILKGLNSQEKLALIELMLEESPDVASTLASKIGQNSQRIESNTILNEKSNPLLQNMPYPPDLDRRKISKNAIFEPMIFDSQKSQRSFVDKQNVATSGAATIHEMELGRNIPRNEYFSANVEKSKYPERQDTNTTFLKRWST